MRGRLHLAQERRGHRLARSPSASSRSEKRVRARSSRCTRTNIRRITVVRRGRVQPGEGSTTSAPAAGSWRGIAEDRPDKPACRGLRKSEERRDEKGYPSRLPTLIDVKLTNRRHSLQDENRPGGAEGDPAPPLDIDPSVHPAWTGGGTRLHGCRRPGGRSSRRNTRASASEPERLCCHHEPTPFPRGGVFSFLRMMIARHDVGRTAASRARGARAASGGHSRRTLVDPGARPRARPGRKSIRSGDRFNDLLGKAAQANASYVPEWRTDVSSPALRPARSPSRSSASHGRSSRRISHSDPPPPPPRALPAGPRAYAEAALIATLPEGPARKASSSFHPPLALDVIDRFYPFRAETVQRGNRLWFHPGTRPRAHVITNWHVLEGADRAFRAFLPTAVWNRPASSGAKPGARPRRPARARSRRPPADTGPPAPNPPPPPPFATNEIEVGQTALAIGNSLRLSTGR